MENTERFTDRVDDYVKYRPSYPRALVSVLHEELGLVPSHIIADLGSGTGLSAQVFLENGNRVYGVEPNDNMRRAGELALAGFEQFTSVKGTAEDTTLGPHSVDFVIAGQAFHWFDPARARKEMKRILRAAAGKVILVWNTWHQEETPFMSTYRELVHRYALDKAVESRHSQDKLLASIAAFFAAGSSPNFEKRVLENVQRFDFEGLLGRARSASYNPPVGHPSYAPMVEELRALFGRHQSGGHIDFAMKTQVFWGSL